MHFRCLGGHGCFPYFASIGNIVKTQKPKDMFATPKMNKMRFKKISAPAAGDAVAPGFAVSSGAGVAVSRRGSVSSFDLC